MNNVCDITNYQQFEVDPIDPTTQRFTQTLPDPSVYIQDAPAVPQVLGKSSSCAVEQSCGTGMPAPNIPTHSICDHVYLWQGATDANDPTQIVVTHRYGRKYSTTVFATRSRSMEIGALTGEPTLAAEARASKSNFLRAAVVRK